MGVPTDEGCVRRAERQLGRSLPAPLRERLLRNNGGDIAVTGYTDDDDWQLLSVWDDRDRRRATRSADHIVAATERAHQDGRLPASAVVIAHNGTGDLLLVVGDDDVVWWDHETGDAHPAQAEWRT